MLSQSSVKIKISIQKRFLKIKNEKYYTKITRQKGVNVWEKNRMTKVSKCLGKKIEPTNLICHRYMKKLTA